MSVATAIRRTLADALDVAPFLKAREVPALAPWMRQVAARSETAGLSDYALHENQAKTYAQSSWVHICVSRTAEAMAGVPYNVYQTQGEEKTALLNHPMEQLMRRPNYRWDGFEFKEATAAYLELCGNCYWFLSPATGPPLEMWILRPDRVQIVPSETEWIQGYIYTVNGVECPLSPEEVIHFKRFHPLRDYEGMSAIEAAALTLELDDKAKRWELEFFKEGGIPSAVVDFGEISKGDYDTAVAQWQGKFKGVAGRHKVAFVRGGDTKVSPISMPQKDMQFLEGRKATKEEVYNIFGRPLGLDDPNATEANAKVAERTFTNRTVYPKLQRMGGKVSEEILPRFGDGLVGEFEDVRIGEGKELWLQEIESVRQGTVGPHGMPEPLMTRDEIREKYFDMRPYVGEIVSPLTPVATKVEGNGGGQEDSAELREELRRWRDVSLRLAGKGRNPAGREFKSDVIPADVRATVIEALWAAKTPEEVKAAFAAPFRPSGYVAGWEGYP